MSNHLTADIVERYKRGTLPAGDMLDVDDHLHECEACRGHLADGSGAVHSWQALAQVPQMHLSYEQMAAYVDGTEGQTGEVRELVETHLGDCKMCASEVGDLRQFRASLSAGEAVPERQSAWSAVRRWIVGHPAGLLAIPAALLIWFLIPRATPVAPNVPAAVPAPAALTLTLRDGAETIALDKDGRLVGLTAWSAEDRSRIAGTLAGGRMAVKDLSGVRRGTGTLMGPGDGPAAFGVVSPAGTAVESDRPEFQWRALPGATRYVVAIFDDQLNPVLESPGITGDRWVSTRALARDRVYIWQVKATTPGGVVTAPQPPAPEARFTIVTDAQADAIARARAATPPSRLWLAIVYADAGLVDQAEAELRALQSENPTAPILTSLLDTLRPPKKSF